MARDARNNTGKFDCQVERTNNITLPAYNNYYYMDVHFSAKMFPAKKFIEDFNKKICLQYQLSILK